MNYRRIVIASKNTKKAQEMQSILGDCGVEVLAVSELMPELQSPEETGKTFAENAELKALYFAAHTGLVCVADDSGLEVAALDGVPGVYSSRYAGEDGNDEANNTKLLAALKDVADADRGAQFRTVICVASPSGLHLKAEGLVRGQILREPRGAGGFGYDPLFFHPDIGKSFAEMTPAQKAQISHRGQALAKLKVELPGLLSILENKKNH